MTSPKYPTVVEILRMRAASQPERGAYKFQSEGDEFGVEITYGELDRRARAIAGFLQHNGAEPGDRALLFYPQGIEYVAGFLGCLYAGVVAVPAYPPRNGRGMERIVAIVSNALPRLALTTQPLLSDLRCRLGQICDSERMEWMVTDQIGGAEETTWKEPPLTSETLAFLQYTSGSTGSPRGVMLSHGNLVHNSSLIEESIEVTSESKCVSWLPFFHDMGLIGCIILPLYVGCEAILMSPIRFLQRPLRWLRAIARTKATHSGAPNFAYELCVDRTTAQERADLDLSSWRVAWNAAELIRAETLRRFACAFEASGFRPEAFAPCYGLAESTLLVSGGCNAGPPKLKTLQASALGQHRIVQTDAGDSVAARRLVSCGRIPQGQQVLIVNPETMKKSPSQVGEIWVAGRSIARGYWNSPEQTERTFCACLAETQEGPFLRTGDLGFVHGGELYVTGRIKDLVTICGRNLYPNDIELTVGHSHPFLKSGGAAAFSIVVEDEERLVVLQEEGRHPIPNPGEVKKAIRSAVAEEHGVPVYAVELIPGRLPKTSSGKLQRYACKELYLAGELSA